MAAVTTAAVLGISVIGSAPANAAGSISAQEEQQIVTILNKFDVPASQQTSLIQKVEDNDPWDVYTPGAQPITTDQEVIDGFNYTVKRYADGSTSAVGMQVPTEVSAGGMHPMDVTQCTSHTGSGYANFSGCQVDGWWGTVFVGAINVSFTLVNGGYDYFSATGYGFQQCAAPTNCTSPTRVLYKQSENAYGKAYARWQSDVSSPFGSWNVWVQLNVGGNTYTETTS